MKIKILYIRIFGGKKIGTTEKRSTIQIYSQGIVKPNFNNSVHDA